MHIDFEYRAGANQFCDNVLCCRAEDGFPVDKASQASPYGSYRCDVPEYVLHSLGDYIKEEIKPDTIFWTGDVSPHD